MDRKLRRGLVGLVLALVSGAAVSAAFAQELPATPSSAGPFFDRLPVNREGALLAPLAPLAAWLQLKMRVNPAGEITLFRAELSSPLIEMVTGSKQARLSGHPYDLPVAPQVLDGSLYAPLRFVVESVGFWVEVERHTVILEFPQEELKLQMALPPDPDSQQAKIWTQLARWYGLVPAAVPVDTVKLPHWNLYSRDRKQELLDEIGPDAPTLLEKHWHARAAQGVRIISDATDPEGGAATVQVMVKYADGGIYEDSFTLALETDGWKVRSQSSSQVGVPPPAPAEPPA